MIYSLLHRLFQNCRNSLFQFFSISFLENSRIIFPSHSIRGQEISIEGMQQILETKIDDSSLGQCLIFQNINSESTLPKGASLQAEHGRQVFLGDLEFNLAIEEIAKVPKWEGRAGFQVRITSRARQKRWHTENEDILPPQTDQY